MGTNILLHPVNDDMFVNLNDKCYAKQVVGLLVILKGLGKPIWAKVYLYVPRVKAWSSRRVKAASADDTWRSRIFTLLVALRRVYVAGHCFERIGDFWTDRRISDTSIVTYTSRGRPRITDGEAKACKQNTN